MPLSLMLDALEDAGLLRGQQLCELGKIKIGGLGESRPTKSGGTFRLPQKYDHFVITTMQRNQVGDLMTDKPLMDKLTTKHGDPDGKLRRIPIRLLSDDLDEALQSAFVWYGGKTVAARSDGQTVTWFYDGTNGKKLAEPREEPWRPEMLGMKDSKGNKLFKCHSVLNCVIAAEEARWGGVYKFRTTSLISFKQLAASLVHLSKLTNGILVGMPLQLVLRPMQVAPEGKPSTVYVVHVELLGPDLLQLQQQAVQQAKLKLECRQQLLSLDTQYKRLLAPPGHESNGEAAELEAEFHAEEPPPEAPPNFSLIDDDEPTPAPDIPVSSDPEAEPPADVPLGTPESATGLFEEENQDAEPADPAETLFLSLKSRLESAKTVKELDTAYREVHRQDATLNGRRKPLADLYLERKMKLAGAK